MGEPLEAMGRFGAGSRGRDDRSPAERLERDLTDLFDRLFTPANPFRRVSERHWHPHVDIYESERVWIVRVELAGVDPASLELVKEDTCLVLRGERVDPLAERGLTCLQLEIAHGPLERVICLPGAFSEQGVRADYSESSGVLEVTVEKEVVE